MMSEFGRAKDLYFGADMEASIALSGQVCGRIDTTKPVAQIIRERSRTLSNRRRACRPPICVTQTSDLMGDSVSFQIGLPRLAVSTVRYPLR